jgi:hypothetical protein
MMNQPGFFDVDQRLEAISAKGDPLNTIDAAVPWESFRASIEAVTVTRPEERKSNAGRRGYDTILKFKMLLLASLYNLSDENEQVKNGETPNDWRQHPARNRQKDKDARWTKKHGRSYFGYKNHVGIDKANKFIRKWDVSDAAVHDSQKLDAVLDRANTNRNVWADSAYVTTHPSCAAHAPAAPIAGVARASRMAVRALRPLRRPVSTMEQRAA